jgi:hypothetical protein
MTLTPARKRHFAYALGVLLVLLAWHQVFAMTGVLWWNAPQNSARVAVPAPLPEARLNTAWVDPVAFLKTHPEWNPR